MSGGKVSGLILELIGLDIAEGLGLYLGDDVPVDIRCLVIDTPIEDGVVRPDTLLLDTPDTLIKGEGRFELASEMLQLKLIPEPKDLSLLTFRSEIEIEGTLADISVAPDVFSMLEMLPPIDLGTAEDAPCDQLVERALAGTE